MENTGYQDLPGIHGLSLLAEIDLQDCQFHMQNIGSLIGRSLFLLEYGGNHTISNLNSKDISSYDNIITISFNQAGSVLITDSQFENITKIGNTVIGGAIKAVLTSPSNRLDISNCKFSACQAQDTFGGAIYSQISNSNAQITLTRTQFLQCYAQSGGGLCAKIIFFGGSIIIENSCEFKECNANSGNGGGIYAEITSIQNSSNFIIRDALIQNCQAIASASTTPPTGFGGGIFIGGTGTYVPSTKRLDLKGMKIYNNSASSG
ncbi:MAG: hypothetical protein EZS28_048973, partial [Streblomastix strix]